MKNGMKFIHFSCSVSATPSAKYGFKAPNSSATVIALTRLVIKNIKFDFSRFCTFIQNITRFHFNIVDQFFFAKLPSFFK